MAAPEERLQIRCAMFSKSHVLAPCKWTAIEHGRKHAGTTEQRAREWQRLERKGVKKGLSDLWYIMPGFILCCELKAGRNTESDAQEAWGADLRAMGHGYEVPRSVEQLAEALERHGIPLAPGWRVAAMHHDAALETPKPLTKKPRNPRIAKPKAPRGRVERGNRLALAMARGWSGT